MAIAWIYKQDYAAGGMKMLTVVDANGERAGLLAVRTAIAMIPMSLIPLIASARFGADRCELAAGSDVPDLLDSILPESERPFG